MLAAGSLLLLLLGYVFQRGRIYYFSLPAYIIGALGLILNSLSFDGFEAFGAMFLLPGFILAGAILGVIGFVVGLVINIRRHSSASSTAATENAQPQEVSSSTQES